DGAEPSLPDQDGEGDRGHGEEAGSGEGKRPPLREGELGEPVAEPPADDRRDRQDVGPDGRPPLVVASSPLHRSIDRPGPSRAASAPDTIPRPARRAAAARVNPITGQESPGHPWRPGLHCRVMDGSTTSVRAALPLSRDEMWAAFLRRDR